MLEKNIILDKQNTLIKFSYCATNVIRWLNISSNNVETVKKFYEIMMSGDPSKLPTVLDQGIKLEMMKGWPYGGTYSGLDSEINDLFPKSESFLTLLHSKYMNI